jgi:serine/threonine protein phosphatase PrpC
MTLEYTARSRSDAGRVREQNEDMPLADLPLVGVADGMGGHEGGEVASRLAIETLTSWKDRLEGRAGREAADVLRDAFTEANRVVFQKGVEDESLLGMGTTLTIGWLGSGTLSLAHVGDSRAYLLRNGQLQQLTEDQTVAQEWVRRGRLSEEEAAASPHRHILLQAIGADTDRLDIVTTTVPMRPGDRLLFASDGLSGMVKDADIRDLLIEHTDPDEACTVLIDAANRAGGEDNISVVLVDVSGEAEEGADDDVSAPVVVERDGGAASPGRRVPRTALVIGGAVLLLVVMAIVFVLRPSTSSYVVATRSDNVVVLKGRPGASETEPAKGEVVKTYENADVEEFPTTVRRELHSGIVVESLREADRVVDRLPRLLGPGDTPRPTEKPTPEPSPGEETPFP